MNIQSLKAAADAIQHAYFEAPDQVYRCTQTLTRTIAGLLAAQDPIELNHLTATLGPLIQAADASPFPGQAERWRGLSEIAEIFSTLPQQLEVDRLLDPSTTAGALAHAIARHPGQTEAQVGSEPEEAIEYPGSPWTTDTESGNSPYMIPYEASPYTSWPSSESVPGEMVLLIGRQPGVNVSALAESLEKSKSHISNELSKLERAGLLRRIQQGKTRRLYLTAMGRKCLQALTEKAQRVVERDTPVRAQFLAGLGVNFLLQHVYSMQDAEPGIGGVRSKPWFAVPHYAGSATPIGVGHVYLPESAPDKGVRIEGKSPRALYSKVKTGSIYEVDVPGYTSQLDKVFWKMQASKKLAIVAGAAPVGRAIRAQA